MLFSIFIQYHKFKHWSTFCIYDIINTQNYNLNSPMTAERHSFAYVRDRALRPDTSGVFGHQL